MIAQQVYGHIAATVTNARSLHISGCPSGPEIISWHWCEKSVWTVHAVVGVLVAGCAVGARVVGARVGCAVGARVVGARVVGARVGLTVHPLQLKRHSDRHMGSSHRS